MKQNQTDYQCAIALKTAEATRLEGVLKAAVRAEAIPARPDLTGNLIENFAAIDAHVAELRKLVGMNSQTARLDTIARSTAGAGLRGTVQASSESSAKPTAATAPAWNPDAAILAAHGVATYAELSALEDDEPSAAGIPANTPGVAAKLPSAADGIGHPGHVQGWNPDAAILAARGVATLEELNSKFCEGKKING